MKHITFALFAVACALSLESLACGQTHPATPVLNIDASKVTAQVSPTLYGLMTEEINYSYEGGLYGELIQNRIFRRAAERARSRWTKASRSRGPS